MDKVKNQRPWLLTFLATVAILGLFQSQSYALDVTLQWDANLEPDLAGYRIYYRAGSSGGRTLGNYTNYDHRVIAPAESLNADPAVMEFRAQDLVDGPVYYFVVTANDTEGFESEASNEANTGNPVPTLSLFQVNGVAGDTQVYTNNPSRQVTLRIAASDDVSIDQYLVLDNDSNYTHGTFLPVPGTPAIDKDFTAGFQLNDFDGNRMLYAWVRDDQGAISATTSKANVILDRTPPAVSISYDPAAPYNQGDIVTVTANFSDANPISGAPRVSINYAGNGSDISMASMTEVSNAEWTYAATIPSGNDGTATVTISGGDIAGNPVGSHSGNTFEVDNTGPSVQGTAIFDPINAAVQISYSESNMQNALVAGNYTLDNGAIVSGVTDVTGEGRTFRLSLSNLQSYMIYTMTVTSGMTGVLDSAGNPIPADQRTIRGINDADSDGMADDWEISWFGDTTSKNGTADTDGDGMMDVREYNVARANPGWAARWNLSPRNGDSDGDGVSDKYEVDYGMNPVDASDRNLDSDSDGWTNYEEYLAGYAANNANSPVPAPPQVREVIPAGNVPIPSNSTFAIRVEATQGINIAEPSGVTVTITEPLGDGSRTYVRNLNNENGRGDKLVAAIPLDSGGTATRNLWVAYYRSNETAMTIEFASGVTVTATFEVTDVRNDSMIPRTLTSRIQTAAEKQDETENSPFMVLMTDAPQPGFTTSGVTNTMTMLDGAAIIYDSLLPQESGVTPYVGPTTEDLDFNAEGYDGVGVAMNLLPPTVFPDGVALMVPCPGYSDVSGLYIFYHNGEEWVMACDPNGNVQPDGAGWMVPGSRVNHNGNPAWIEIEVHHFSAVIAATTSGTTVTVETGGGGGCFVDSLTR